MGFKSIIGKARLTLSLVTAALALVVSVAAIIPLVSCNRDEGVSSAVQPLPDFAWDLNEELELETEPVSSASADGDSATVFFTKNITSEGIMAIYDAIGVRPAAGDNVAVKVHTGESVSKNSITTLHILKEELIGELVKSLDGTLVECNVAYDGLQGMGTRRGKADTHYQLAIDHGFDFAPFVVLDESSDITIPVTGPGVKYLGNRGNRVGARIAEFDYHLVLSHFKGHGMGGFGGAIKNTSIGYASRSGKFRIHSTGSSDNNFGSPANGAFTEAMAEAAKSVVDYANRNGGQKIVFINVMNNMSIACDCILNPAPPAAGVSDIGILGSLDPVALDQACIDKFNGLPNGSGKTAFINQVNRNDIQGMNAIAHGQTIGLGNRTYRLVDLDVTSSIKEPERIVR